ncbi:hypothetical protein [Aeromonas caviae]|uniref:Uncharacterized protein n=1 Tax=Aeromonas caviae TaxID=648 RepID=A0AAJ5ZH13_AERCA|nr:hypothetical protein [Aeromonas caviae]WFG00234.1 hypothetical protein P5S46_22325 [Aeromonas caviae]
MSTIHLVFQPFSSADTISNALLGWTLSQYLRVSTGTRPLVLDVGSSTNQLSSCSSLQVVRFRVITDTNEVDPKAVESLLARVIGAPDSVDVVVLCDTDSMLQLASYLRFLSLKTVLPVYGKKIVVHVAQQAHMFEKMDLNMLKPVLSLGEEGEGGAYSIGRSNATTVKATNLPLLFIPIPAYPHETELLERALREGICVGDSQGYKRLSDSEQVQLERFYRAATPNFDKVSTGS